MNIKNFWKSTCVLLSAWATVACSGENGLTPVEENISKNQPLSYTLKLSGGVASDAERALSFDMSQANPAILETSDWTTHVFFRKEGATFVGYAKIEWEFTGRDSNGKIRLQQRNLTFDLENTNGDLPSAGETWYIAGIAGGGKLNSAKTAVDFAYDETLDGALAQNQVRVPLTFAWTKLNIVENAADEAFVNFKPQGTLLHVYANNKTTVAMGSYLNLTSNVLDRAGGYDFATANTSVSEGAMPTWTFTNAERTASLRVPMSGAVDAKMQGLVWGMPRSGVSSPSTTIGNTPIDYKVYNVGTTTAFTSTATFRSGRAYQVNVDVYRPKLPIEYVAEYNMKNDTEFATSHSNDASAYWNLADAVSKFSNITINGKEYHLPGLRELYAIGTPAHVIAFNSSLTYYLTPYSNERYNITEEAEVAGVTSVYTSDYYNTGDKVSYGIRFQSAGDQLKVAYRYRIIGDWILGNLNNYLEITVRYLGSGFSGTLTTINNEDFWNDSSAEYITRIIPATGRMVGTSVRARGTRGYVSGKDLYSFNNRCAVSVGYDAATADMDMGEGRPNTATALFPTRLFSND